MLISIAIFSGEEERITFWDVLTGEEIIAIPHDSESSHSVAISPDKSLLAAGCDDGTIKFLELETGLDDLLRHGCEWLQDYMEHNPNVENDRSLFAQIKKWPGIE